MARNCMTATKELPVLSGVPPRVCFEAIVFNIFINDIDSGIECTFRKFVGVTKPSDSIDTGEGMPYRGP